MTELNLINTYKTEIIKIIDSFQEYYLNRDYPRDEETIIQFLDECIEENDLVTE